MEALEAEFSAEELEDFHVVLDGGVRRGTDIFKAIALGARSVGVGKPAAFAMSAYGQAGIEQMLSGLRAEFSNVMQLMGVSSVAQIRAEGRRMCELRSLHLHVQPAPYDYLYQPVNVLTHGTGQAETSRHWMLQGGNGHGDVALPHIASGEEMVSTTTTTTTTAPDGSSTTTTQTTNAPLRALDALRSLGDGPMHSSRL